MKTSVVGNLSGGVEDARHAILNQFYEARVAWDDALWGMADLSLGYARTLAPDLGLGPGMIDGWKPRLFKILSGETGFSPKTLLESAYTAHTFPDAERVKQDVYMTFHHHVLCAFTDNPNEWLVKATNEGWSLSDLRREINKTKPKPEHCIYEDRAIWCEHYEKRVEREECENCPTRCLP